MVLDFALWDLTVKMEISLIPLSALSCVLLDFFETGSHYIALVLTT